MELYYDLSWGQCHLLVQDTQMNKTINFNWFNHQRISQFYYSVINITLHSSDKTDLEIEGQTIYTMLQ